MVSQPPPPGTAPTIRVQPPPSDASRDSWEEDPYSSGSEYGEPQGAGGREYGGADGGKSSDIPAILRPGGGFAAPAPASEAPSTHASTHSSAQAQDPSPVSTPGFAPGPSPSPPSVADDLHSNVWDAPDYQPPPLPPNQIPSALQPGVRRKDTNPFYKKSGSQTSDTTPEQSFGNLSLNEPGFASAQNPTAFDQPPPPSNVFDEIDRDPWAAPAPPPTQPSPQPQHQSTGTPNLISFPSDEEPRWDQLPQPTKQEPAPDRPPPPVPANAVPADFAGEQSAWDDLGSYDKGKGKDATLSAGQAAQLDDWNLIDAEPSSRSSPNLLPVDDSETRPALPEKKESQQSDIPTPALPPRVVGESSRWVPTRQAVDASTETYQVKNIKWHDASSATNPRVSPILVQNANGPCPLVALVNALTMTTPADEPDLALVSVLRSREQVSLNLLLDAVFDELMSPRRTGFGDALPDVSDLYAFLLSLHTGMNVNPRFIPTPQMVNAYKRTSLTHLHPAERADLIPGTFENTHEMGLYATFSIPLIHGWLPAQSDPAYEAMERQAASYEDVQNLLFREEELEHRLGTSEEGLSEAEQQLYQDIITIKMFLNASATQLTPWGIEVIGKAIRPGTFAILFRNDHFSTLYCHPETHQLLTLVTDAGYRKHGDVVWESLVDVNGERTEFFSGNFRAVEYSEQSRADEENGVADGGGEWTTVQSSRRGKAPEHVEDDVAGLSSREQEDRDLALALQLQEEEDERIREAEARRQQESRLSEQYIEQQARRPVPANAGRGAPAAVGRGSANDLVPGRRSSSNISVPVTGGAPAQEVRPLVPPRRPAVTRRPDDGGDEAPPSYEQASQSPAFVPPRGHPSHAGSVNSGSPGPASAATGASRRPQRTGQSATGRRPSGQAGATPGAAGGNGGPGRGDRDCVVM